MPKDSPKGSLPGSPQVQADSSAPASATTILNNEAKSPSVQHTATQVITKREKVEEGWKKEENVQKKIMKSDRSHQSHRKGEELVVTAFLLLNFLLLKKCQLCCL